MINLIYNKDIAALEKKDSLKPDELLLVRMKNATETIVQQYCHRLFNEMAEEYRRKFGKEVMVFVQIDNGGKMGFAQKKKKKAEGTKKGFPDASLFLGSPCGQFSKVIFVEFKRMGTPSQIQLGDEQVFYHAWLNEIGFSAYITNNPIYFRDVILKEVREFYETRNRS